MILSTTCGFLSERGFTIDGRNNKQMRERKNRKKSRNGETELTSREQKEFQQLPFYGLCPPAA